MQMTILSLLHRTNAHQMRHEFLLLPDWLYKSFIGINPDTCHFQTLGFKDTLSDFSSANISMTNTSEEKKLP